MGKKQKLVSKLKGINPLEGVEARLMKECRDFFKVYYPIVIPHFKYQNDRLVPRNSIVIRVISALHTAIIILHFFLQCYNVVKIFTIDTKKGTESHAVDYSWLIMSWVTMWTSVFHEKKPSVISGINLVNDPKFTLMKEVFPATEDSKPQKATLAIMVEQNIFGIWKLSISSNSILLMLMILRKPANSRYWYYWVPESLRSFPIMLIVLIFEYYELIARLLACYYVGVATAVYAIRMQRWFQDLKAWIAISEAAKHTDGVEPTHRKDNLMLVLSRYRKLMVLNHVFNMETGEVVHIYFLYLILIHITVTYTAIMIDDMPAATSTFFYWWTFAIFPLVRILVDQIAGIHEESKVMLRKWQEGYRRASLEYKYIRTLSPLGLRSGREFFHRSYAFFYIIALSKAIKSLILLK